MTPKPEPGLVFTSPTLRFHDWWPELRLLPPPASFLQEMTGAYSLHPASHIAVFLNSDAVILDSDDSVLTPGASSVNAPGTRYVAFIQVLSRVSRPCQHELVLKP